MKWNQRFWDGLICGQVIMVIVVVATIFVRDHILN